MEKENDKRRGRRKPQSNQTNVLPPKNPYEKMSIQELMEVIKAKDSSFKESQNNNNKLMNEYNIVLKDYDVLEKKMENLKSSVSALNLTIGTLKQEKLGLEKQLNSVPNWIKKLFI